jgi:hypothetical protein
MQYKYRRSKIFSERKLADTKIITFTYKIRKLDYNSIYFDGFVRII